MKRVVPEKPIQRVPSSLDSALKASTGYLLARIGMESRRVWAKMLAEENLTPGHFGVLMALEQLGATSQRRLSKIVGVDPRNTVGLMDLLAERRLVERKPHPGDRRRHSITLTDAGISLIRKLRRSGEELEEVMLMKLNKPERTALHKILLKLFIDIAGLYES